MARSVTRRYPRRKHTVASKNAVIIPDEQVEAPASAEQADALVDFLASRWVRYGAIATGAALALTRLGGIAHAYDGGGGDGGQHMMSYDGGYDSPSYF